MLLAPMVHVGIPYHGTQECGRLEIGSTDLRAAAPLRLQPDGHFQPPQWPTSVDPGGRWLSLDVASTDTADGAHGGATGTRHELW